MADFEVKPATGDNTPIILGITGPSGCGKTLSALLLAHGICDVTGGKVGIIDTEGRRARRYADKARWPNFDFMHMDFQPPFSSDRYAEAIRAMAKALEYKGTIIVDSMSHEHEGPGGYLEFHETEIDRMLGAKKGDYKERQKMTFTGWIQPAAARRRLINSFLQTPMNFIFCFRAKEKIKVVGGGAPILLGWQAIAGDEFVYEMITRFLLPPGAAGMPDWSEAAFAHGAAKRDAQDRPIFPDEQRITREMGQAVAKVYGATTATSRQQTGTGATTLTKEQQREAAKQAMEAAKNELLEAAEGGASVLDVAWARLNPKQQLALVAYYTDTLVPAAAKADAEAEAQEGQEAERAYAAQDDEPEF